MKNLNRSKLILAIAIFIFLASSFKVGLALASIEQSGSSPESGTTSRLKSTYDALVTLTHGSDSAGAWGDWANYWNRIRSAAIWIPSGDATPADVVASKTFYKDSRTQITGTLALVDYSQQSLVEYDDYEAGDSETEENSWTQTNASPEVWQDDRTSLYWSATQGDFSNLYPNQDHSTCPFFALSDRGAYDGLDADCGNAINACATLSLDDGGGAETDWYFPTQKELMQAYIDGIYNQTDTTWATDGNFLSSTEQSHTPSDSLYVNIASGLVDGVTKVAALTVRCVRRD